MIKNSTRRLIAVAQSAKQFAAHSLDGFQANLGNNRVFELLSAVATARVQYADSRGFLHGGYKQHYT